MGARPALCLAAVLIGLVVTPAAADSPPQVPRASLVQVLRGGRQALVLDRATGDYHVVKVGDAVQGFRIAEIGQDQILLTTPTVPERFFVLPLVEPPAAVAGREPAARPDGSAAAAGGAVAGGGASGVSADGAGAGAAPAPQSVTPPGDAAGAASEAGDVLDPYGGARAGETVLDSDDAATRHPGSVPSVIAPPASRAEPGTDPAAGSSAAPPRTDAEFEPEVDPAEVKTLQPEPGQPGAAGQPAVVTPPPERTRTLSRRQLDAALSDFSALARQMRIERAAGGGMRIIELDRGSFVGQLGIERGDVVRRVAGHTVDTVDEAAAAYAAVASARDVLVEIERHGQPIRIRYQLTR